MLDLTNDELQALQALQARLVRPLAYLDANEAGLSQALREYRVQENHYRSAVVKIERAVGDATDPQVSK